MLKKIRVILALLVFIFLSFLFLDFAGLLPPGLAWLARIQLIPALLALNTGILLALLLLTLLTGRVYCSAVCPLGTLQDIISRLGGRGKKRYQYKKPYNLLRYLMLAIVGLSLLAGFGLTISLLDPYSTFGRIAFHIARPLFLLANNVLAYFSNQAGSFYFYHMEVFISSPPALAVSLLTLLAICFLAARYGRLYCNSLCQAGALLGLLARFSLLKPRIDQRSCTQCQACARVCKASCIDVEQARIDHSRCVTCFNCLQACKFNALRYGGKNSNPPLDRNKRRLLQTLGLSAAWLPGSALAAASPLQRQTAIAPPGALAHRHLNQHCSACHLCVSQCPTQVLKPAFMEYGLAGMLQPVMYFEKGYCTYDCVICTQICPNQALHCLSVEEKHATQLGRVVLAPELCIVYTEGTSCGACAEHCPTQAVTMVPYKEGLTQPRLDTSICVGCGACEYICPTLPLRAIFVEGHEVQQTARPVTQQNNPDPLIDDFGF